MEIRVIRTIIGACHLHPGTALLCLPRLWNEPKEPIVDTSTATLNVVRTETEPCRLKLDIEVPTARVDEVFAETIRLFNRSARIPGFRPGKTPEKILRNRFRKEIADEVKQRLLRDCGKEALEQENVSPETNPRVENEEAVQAIEGETFVFAVAFDVAPEFELPEYKGIKVSRDISAVGDESVQEVISGWLQQRASYGRVERAAEEGDLLKVSYQGVLPDGEEEPPETVRFLLDQQETWLALREPELLPGATAVLAGVEEGDSREATIEFPEDYAEKTLAGKSVTYAFEVLEVHAAVVPELTDDLAREVGAESADQVRERVRENLVDEHQRNQNRAVREQIVRAVMDGLDLDLPPSLLRRETHEALRSLYEREARSGQTPDDVQGRQQELMDQASAVARQHLARQYVLRKIAEAEEIEVEPHDLNVAVASLAQMQSVTPRVMVRRLRDSGRLGDVLSGVRESKVVDHLLELADVTETGAAPGAESPAEPAADADQASAEEE